MDIYNSRFIDKGGEFGEFEDEELHFDREETESSYHTKYTDDRESEAPSSNQFSDFPYSSIGVYLK
ncbi:MAG: hypothetical protein ACE5OR_15310, partial [bacterium]